MQTLHFEFRDVKSQLKHKTKAMKMLSIIMIPFILAVWKQCGKSNHKTVHIIICDALILKTRKGVHNSSSRSPDVPANVQDDCWFLFF